MQSLHSLAPSFSKTETAFPFSMNVILQDFVTHMRVIDNFNKSKFSVRQNREN